MSEAVVSAGRAETAMRPRHALFLMLAAILTMFQWGWGWMVPIVAATGWLLAFAGILPRARERLWPRVAMALIPVILAARLITPLLAEDGEPVPMPYAFLHVSVLAGFWMIVCLDLTAIARQRGAARTSIWLKWCAFLIPMGFIGMLLSIALHPPWQASRQEYVRMVVMVFPFLVGLTVGYLALIFCLFHFTKILEGPQHQ